MNTLRILLTVFGAASLCAQVRYEDVLKGPGENWLTLRTPSKSLNSLIRL